MQPSPLARPGLLLLFSLLLARTLSAAEGGFAATLSTEQRTVAGITTLGNDERAALDQLVADDLAFARREKLTALDGTFVSRRAEPERKQAGLDQLTAEQLAKLNELVANALAARTQPRERPRLKDNDVLVKKRGEVHGSVTVGYAWGSGGRSTRFGAFNVNYYDPESRIGISIGVSSSDGDGFWGYPGYYGGDYAYPGFYPGHPDYDYPGFGGGPWYRPGSSTTGMIDLSYHGENWGASAGYAFTRGDDWCFRPAVDTGFRGGRGFRRP